MRALQTLFTVLAAAILSAGLTGCQLVPLLPTDVVNAPMPQVQPTGEPGVTAKLLRIVDGDTIAVVPTAELPATNERGTEHYVRVLSVDAPEMNKMGDAPAECGAQDATDHLVSLLHDHAEVSLVFDPVSDRTDRFGRSLAYVQTLGAPSIDVGLEQVRAGYAEAWYPRSEPQPSRFSDYSDAQRAAEGSAAGSFGSCTSVGR